MPSIDRVDNRAEFNAGSKSHAKPGVCAAGLGGTNPGHGGWLRPGPGEIASSRVFSLTRTPESQLNQLEGWER